MSILHGATTVPPIIQPKSSWIQRWIQKQAARIPWLRNKVFLLGLDGRSVAKIPSSRMLHGHLLEDNYKYLEDVVMPDAPKYKEAQYAKYVENEFYRLHEIEKDLVGSKFRLWSELDCRVVTTSREGGFDKGEERIGEFLYYTRQLESGGTDIGFFRKRMGESDVLGEELINPHELKRRFGYAHCTIGICRVSPDGSLLAYTLSVEGGDRYICHIKSLHNDEIFHVLRSNNIVSVEFGSQGNFFYTECNELNRPYRVMCLDVYKGLLSAEREVYVDKDERFFVDVRKTKDGKFICITSDAKSHGNVMILPATFPTLYGADQHTYAKGPLEIAGKEAWGWLEHHNGTFFMVTSQNAPNYKVVEAPVADVIREGKSFNGWKDFVSHNPKVQIQDVDIFRTHLVLYENSFGFDRSQQLRVIDLRGRTRHDRTKDVYLHFPPLVAVTPGLNKNFDQTEMCFMYSSLIEPSTECVYRFDSGHSPKEVQYMLPEQIYARQRSEMLSPWDYSWPYVMYRDTVTSHDGVEVPITICHRRDLFTEEITDYDPFPDTPRRCLLYVYGSYGEVPSLHFQLAPYMWLIRRRWVIAFAHVRGGGEKLGWEQQGKGPTKINTTLDFVACCEYLHKQGYTTPESLIVCGNSAGCVPIAAAANMYGRNLFDFALMRSPFLDITNTMTNPDLPLSIAEREDWGDPLNNPQDFENIRKYDPYLNIRDDQDYPGMVISVSMDDDRVPPWNALKYVARIREARAARGVDPIKYPFVLRLFEEGGHYVFGNLKELCEEIRWIAYFYSMGGPTSKTDDMDMMQTLHNQSVSGVMDHDDAQKAFLKWDAWEDERKNYYERMMDTENRVAIPRQVPVKKPSQFYWQEGPPPSSDEDLPPMPSQADSHRK